MPTKKKQRPSCIYGQIVGYLDQIHCVYRDPDSFIGDAPQDLQKLLSIIKSAQSLSEKLPDTLDSKKQVIVNLSAAAERLAEFEYQAGFTEHQYGQTAAAAEASRYLATFFQEHSGSLRVIRHDLQYEAEKYTPNGEGGRPKDVERTIKMIIVDKAIKAINRENPKEKQSLASIAERFKSITHDRRTISVNSAGKMRTAIGNDELPSLLAWHEAKGQKGDLDLELSSLLKTPDSGGLLAPKPKR